MTSRLPSDLLPPKNRGLNVGSWWLGLRSCPYWLNAVYQDSAFEEGVWRKWLQTILDCADVQALAPSAIVPKHHSTVLKRVLTGLLQLVKPPLLLSHRNLRLLTTPK